MCIDKTLNEYWSNKSQKIISCIAELGFKLEDNIELEIIDVNMSTESIDSNTVYYYYDGPLDEKTREFCAKILLMGKFFTQDDIDKLSNKAGYDVDLYMGSYNCRHKWKRARIKGKIQDGYVPENPTTTEINRIAKDSISNGK